MPHFAPDNLCHFALDQVVFGILGDSGQPERSVHAVFIQANQVGAPVNSEDHPALVDHDTGQPREKLRSTAILIQVLERLPTRFLDLVGSAAAVAQDKACQFGASLIMATDEFSKSVGI